MPRNPYRTYYADGMRVTHLGRAKPFRGSQRDYKPPNDTAWEAMRRGRKKKGR